MNPWRDSPTLVGRHVTLRPLIRADRAALLAAYEPLATLFTTALPTERTIDAWFDVAEEQVAAGRQMRSRCSMKPGSSRARRASGE